MADNSHWQKDLTVCNISLGVCRYQWSAPAAEEAHSDSVEDSAEGKLDVVKQFSLTLMGICGFRIKVACKHLLASCHQ